MTNGDVTFQVTERNGHQFIVIKEQESTESDSTSGQAVEIPVSLLPEIKRAVAALEENSGGTKPATASFAHESEAEFARILDFYHIVWQYEPRTFPIEWDEEGNRDKELHA